MHGRGVRGFQHVLAIHGRILPDNAMHPKNRRSAASLKQRQKGRQRVSNQHTDLRDGVGAPKTPAAHYALGMTSYQQRNFPQAILHLEQAHQLAPKSANLHNSLGAVHLSAGNLAKAQEFLEQAVDLDPLIVNAHNNLGVVLLESHQPVLAEAHFRKVLETDSHHPDALSNLGNSLQAQARWREALHYYAIALEQNPRDCRVLNNIGSTLIALRESETALQVFQQAISLEPEAAQPHLNLGQALIGLGRIDEAVLLLTEACRAFPQWPQAHRYLGKALDLHSEHNAAIDCFRKALDLDPGYAHAHSSLGLSLQRRGDIQSAVAHVREALRLRPDLHATHSCLLFMLSGDPSTSPTELLGQHRLWGEMHGRVSFVFEHTAKSGDPDRPLRIGYVSPDFRSHAVANYFQPVLREHDRSQATIYCYYNYFCEDEVTKRIKKQSEWRSIWGLSDLQVAQLVRQDQIDILVDLAGHTAGNRLRAFAHKPAPVQVSWLGYPHTTGLSAIDYFVTNIVQDPPGEGFHTEELLRLSSDTCFDPPQDAPEVAPSPYLRNGYLTLGSLHRHQKLSSEVFDLWCSVLGALPTSRLLLFNTGFTEDAIDSIAARISERGIDLDRCEFRRDTKGSDYLSVYHEIDLGLDVFPWSGGTTTREALWMGVPVIGLMGNRRSARSSAAVLTTIGHPEWIASSPAAYLAIVREFASDPSRLTRVRSILREQMQSTICNAARYTAELECAYRTIWRRWCSQRMASSFSSD